MRLKQKLFSLIELLVAISIITILAGMVIGGLNAVSEKNNLSDTKSTIMLLESAMLKFFEQNGKYPTKAVNDKDPTTGLVDSEIHDDYKRTLVKLGAKVSQLDGSDDYEILDAWNNPLYIIYPTDYESDTRTAVFKVGGHNEFQKRRSFQIISGGPDGELGSSYGDKESVDNITNYEMKKSL